MNHSFTFQFDELPLFTTGGFEAFLTAGEAEIEYRSETDWAVTDISSIGYRWVDDMRQHEKRSVSLDHASPLFGMILHVIEHEWAQKIADAIHDDIYDRRNSDEEPRFLTAAE